MPLRWEAGRHYTAIAGSGPSVERPGKIEVAEVFSYGCIHCFRAVKPMAALGAKLPADAVFTYVHASFNPAEGWPMFQRAWYTAQSLGIGETLHEQMFAAVWETGEIPLLDPATGRLRSPMPTIENAARFYARLSPVKADAFLKAAQSPEINATVERADALIKAWRVPGRPALVVNGRYLVDNAAVSSWDELSLLVNYLVGLERQRLRSGAPVAR
jgi:thiol:disulfide interchange protein DsbA